MTWNAAVEAIYEQLAGCPPFTVEPLRWDGSSIAIRYVADGVPLLRRLEPQDAVHLAAFVTEGRRLKAERHAKKAETSRRRAAEEAEAVAVLRDAGLVK